MIRSGEFHIDRQAVIQVAEFLRGMAKAEIDQSRREFYLVAAAGLDEHAHICDPETDAAVLGSVRCEYETPVN